MKWSISDLDKNKTEQSIVNETERLKNCREVLDNLKREYEAMSIRNRNEESKIMQKITSLGTSIKMGEKFVEDCKNHLNDFN